MMLTLLTDVIVFVWSSVGFWGDDGGSGPVGRMSWINLLSPKQSSTLAVIFQAQLMSYAKNSNLEITNIPVKFLFLNSAKYKQQGWKNEHDLYLPFHVPKITNGQSQDKCPHHTYYSTSHWNVRFNLISLCH